MTTPVRLDPAFEVINAFIAALKLAFDPDQTNPPDGGGSKNVRFIATDGAPQAAWDAHSVQGSECGEPFLWVRVVRRYRSKNFPEPAININACELPEVIPVEVGIARCAPTSMTAEPTWEQYATEADISLDDSWRLSKALCIATKALGREHEVGTDIIHPFGPEGGVLGWSAQAYVSL